MKLYDIVLLIDPRHSEGIETIIGKQKELLESVGVSVYRFEDWGRKRLFYPIEKQVKAHFICFSVEGESQMFDKLCQAYKINDLLLRYLVVAPSMKITDASPMLIADKCDGNKKLLITELQDHPERLTFKNLLFMNENTSSYSGRIHPKRSTLLSKQDQAKLASSVKLARFLALMPYCDKHAS